MIKPTSLRDHLVSALTELQRDPERLLIFINRGSVVSTLAPGASFEYRYTLTLVITDFGGHPDGVMVPLLDWVRVYQSELLSNDRMRELVAFEAEVLANDKVDLQITLPLTERVGVHRQPDGRIDVEHYPEPVIEGPLPPRRWQLYLQDELIAQWNAPCG